MTPLPPPPVRRAFAPKGAAALLAASVLAGLAACAPGGAGRLPPAAAGAARSAVAPGLRGYPFAAARSVTREVLGVAVSDDFSWLENADDPFTRSWIAAENAYGRRALDAMPARAALRRRLQALLGSTTNDYSALVERGGLVFALKAAPPPRRAILVTLRSVDDASSERVVFDPNEAAPAGMPAIDFFRPSPDGRRVAIGLSGGTVRVREVATGQWLPDAIAHVASPGGGGDVAWNAGGAGFFFTQVPGTGGAGAAQVVFHRLGAAPGTDRVDLSAGLPRLARVRLESTRDGRHVLALVADARGGDVALYLKTADPNGAGAWRRLAAGGDGVRDAQFGDDDALWIHSIAGAPRGKVLRLALAGTGGVVDWGKAATIAAPVEGALQRFAVAGGTLYLAEGRDGLSRLRAIDARTHRSTLVALPANGGVTALVRVGRNDVVARVASWVEPPLWTHVGGGSARRTPLVATSDANFNDSEVVREFAPASDGTAVPVDILRRRGTRLDGRNPVLLAPAGAMNGGMNDATTPEFDAARRAWLDRGGVVALATLRGAPEPGAAWRSDGLRTYGQDAVDDFVAAAGHLVRRGYTRPALLGIRGRGDGAGVVVAALAQRPELFRAAAATDGRYDLLRPQRDPADEHDAPADGRAEARAKFDALLAESPYRQVRDGAAYPAVLLRATAHDERVDPAQSRKMAARLQQAGPDGRVVLLLTSNSSGRPDEDASTGIVDQLADELGFFLDEIVAAQ